MKKPNVARPQTFASLFCFVAALSTLSGCFNSPAPESKTRGSSPFNLDSVPSLPMVDPASLKIGDITIAQYHDPKTGGTLQPFVDFRYSGSTDYVEVQACVEGGSCTPPKNIFDTAATLTNAPSGALVLVKLRGCVNPSRAIGKSNCGSWFEKEYTQWHVADKAKSQLQEEFDAIERSAADLESKLQKVLALRAKRAEKCKAKDPVEAQMLEAEKGLVGSIAKLGGGIVGAIANKLAEKPAPAAPSSTPTTSSGGSGGDSGGSTGDGAGNSGEPEVFTLQSESNLSLAGQSAGEIIVAQASKYVPQVIDALSKSLRKKSEQNSAATTTSSPASGSSSPAPGSNAPAAGSSAPAPGGSAPAAGSSAPAAGSSSPPSDQSNSAAADAAKQTAAAIQGPSVKWDIISDALPSLAEGIFDLANAGRRIALQNMCIESLGKVQSDALQIAEEEVASSVAQLRAAAQAVRAKMGTKP
jgi:hypothetical protein